MIKRILLTCVLLTSTAQAGFSTSTQEMKSASSAISSQATAVMTKGQRQIEEITNLSIENIKKNRTLKKKIYKEINETQKNISILMQSITNDYKIITYLHSLQE